jgi:hypothetical protein
MPETIGQNEERQLIEAVKRAIDLVDGGLSPDDAVEKVAREEHFGPGKINMVAHAYNTGRQTSQWRDVGNILDKLAGYSLVDPARVVARLYGGADREKAARDVSAEYKFPPGWLERPLREKAARAPLPVASAPVEPYRKDPVSSLHKAYGDVRRAKQAAEEVSRLASAAEDKVRRHVAELVGYFKQAGYGRLPFECVESAARAYSGAAAMPLLDVVYTQARLREKRASDKAPVMALGIDLRAEPFSIIRDCIKAAEECNRLRAAAQASHKKVAGVKEESFRPFLRARESRLPAQASSAPTPGMIGDRAASVFGTKSASWGSEVSAIAAGDIIGSGVHHRLHQDDDGDDEDPIGPNPEVSAVRGRAALDGLLADPGNPLSKIPAPDVVKAYNNIVKMTPHLADQPEALQPLLEAHFGGHPAAQLPGALDLDSAIAGRDKTAAVGEAVGTMLSRSLGNFPKTKDDLVEDDWLNLEDPHHHNELRKIRAHAMLNEMLTNPEDPISGHDPDKVLSAFNEISQMSPRLADHPASLRPVLRRRLEGHVEPFEAKELTDIEKNLKDVRVPTPHTESLLKAPQSVFG